MKNFRGSSSLKISTLLCIMFFSAHSKIAIAESSYEKIELYFIPWHILTRTRLSPENVKEMASITMSLSDSEYISRIENKLARLTFRKIEPSYPVNARLVLELFRKDGSSDVYYANMAYITSNHSDKIADLDADFLETLNVFLPLPPGVEKHN